MTARKRLSRYFSERVSFHWYAGPGLTELKLRIGTNHYRLSRWKYTGKRAEWSCRSFRVAISNELVSNETWLKTIGRLRREESA